MVLHLLGDLILKLLILLYVCWRHSRRRNIERYPVRKRVPEVLGVPIMPTLELAQILAKFCGHVTLRVLVKETDAHTATLDHIFEGLLYDVYPCNVILQPIDIDDEGMEID